MSKRQQARMVEGFEELEEARQRVESNTDSKKSHHPNLDNVELGEFDERTVISEVNAYPSDKNINWTDLSRKYKLRKVADGSEFGNGGQVLKAYLSSKGVDLDRFQSTSTPRIRRKRKRGPGGEISFPTTATIREVNETIKQRVNDGIYSVGELIVPKQYSKVTLTQDGQFETELFQVEGRKIPLYDIRQKLLAKQQELGLLRAKQSEYDVMPIEDVQSRLAILNELNGTASEQELRTRLQTLETTRYLTCWSDHSTIAGHTYVLYTYSCLYDPAVFYTNDEMKQRGKQLDVEEIVRLPQIHILAQCGSADNEQLAYADERRSSIASLNDTLTTSTGIVYTDKLLYHHGDMPANAAESGQQYGGNYPCGNCGIHASMFDDMAYCLRRPVLTFTDKHNIFFRGVYGNNRDCKPYGNLTKQNLVRELAKRDLSTLGKKEELVKRLQRELGGIQRVPTLLFNTEAATMVAIGLPVYEMALCEPLHDYSNHIKNLLEEIPSHLPMESKDALLSTIAAIFQGKQCLRACDYRDATVVLPQMLGKHQCFPEDILQLLTTLSEIGRLLYAHDHVRSPQTVLHLYLMTWIHWMLLRTTIPQPKKLTKRKLWGYYAHALLTHAPLQYRLISLRQLNAENEERLFGSLKDITLRTSSRRPGEITYNAFIRLQEESKHSQHKLSTMENTISKHAASMAPTNTIITTEIMANHSHHWQALLECIADYLRDGPGVLLNSTMYHSQQIIAPPTIQP